LELQLCHLKLEIFALGTRGLESLVTILGHLRLGKQRSQAVNCPALGVWTGGAVHYAPFNDIEKEPLQVLVKEHALFIGFRGLAGALPMKS
jgi:hypothetical protein